ncbi:hypothetical protein ATO6_12580 [Oceanicola sp. 22II-s10i]|uniref:tripartite tricarboxylate transporter TctB family protein n=1 Tax=Oceanicola sp. 22II-s10i TaxID=1317116 RepID=UPI000B524E76|nr:tripartite tricarboxylate transporter TctB family protein [Oceanicola sp. 22II-s10i]OWU84510.1 hypothetical protein ATO6_12580 [Oceanicola sp. 22II-s10i]
MLEFIRTRREDLIAGLVTVGIGIFILTESFGYRLGTLRSMGPGYFPMLLAVAMCALGLILILTATPDKPSDGAAQFADKRGVLLVAAAFLAFALMIERTGMVPAIGAAVFLSALANRTTSWLTALILAAATAGTCWLLFSVLLGLQLRAFG